MITPPLKIDLTTISQNILDNIPQIDRAEFVHRLLDEVKCVVKDEFQVLIVSYSHLKNCSYNLSTSPQIVTWTQGSKSHNYAVFLIGEGVFDYGNNHNSFEHLAFSAANIFPIPWGSRCNNYLVWANMTDRIGGNGGYNLYAVYFHKKNIDRIFVKKNFVDGAHHITAIHFEFFNIVNPKQSIGHDHRDTDIVDVQPNDTIAHVSVKYENRFIIGIQFHIYSAYTKEVRSTEWLGGNYGQVHTFPQNAKGIFGRHGGRLDSLGIFY
ncbi:uncharacterized protein SAPINGB_P005924 [Magnusiomyces paraingens]|uniref:Jacalin-type lectin domain-containing protein n=1 Tax=Magnusiomyces paraingens TaxID=2606893 RepID=A0A5E8C783_9ASCO|nr:uncharacterized protein SAPINGB_P005924 [Saprochaete ingens]VVT57881.1 unnamed protein product [Saprochaete ingens]